MINVGDHIVVKKGTSYTLRDAVLKVDVVGVGGVMLLASVKISSTYNNGYIVKLKSSDVEKF